jgi:hypothetical protein
MRFYSQPCPYNPSASCFSVYSPMGGTQHRRAREQLVEKKNLERKREGMYNAEYCVSRTTVLNRLINNSVFSSDLVSGSFCEVGHSGIKVAEVYLRESLIE